MAKYEEIKEVEEEAYRKYQLLWMVEHGYSLDDLFELFLNNLAEIVEEGHPIANSIDISCVEDDLKEMFLDHGFDGECFVCKSEFLSTEYQDPDYVEKLNSL